MEFCRVCLASVDLRSTAAILAPDRRGPHRRTHKHLQPSHRTSITAHCTYTYVQRYTACERRDAKKQDIYSYHMLSADRCPNVDVAVASRIKIDATSKGVFLKLAIMAKFRNNEKIIIQI